MGNHNVIAAKSSATTWAMFHGISHDLPSYPKHLCVRLKMGYTSKCSSIDRRNNVFSIDSRWKKKGNVHARKSKSKPSQFPYKYHKHQNMAFSKIWPSTSLPIALPSKHFRNGVFFHLRRTVVTTSLHPIDLNLAHGGWRFPDGWGYPDSWMVYSTMAKTIKMDD